MYYIHIHTHIYICISGGTRGALGALVPTKFTNAQRNLVIHNRNVSY